MPPPSKLVAWLAGRHVALWAAALAIALTSPSLGNGLLLDDHVHRVALDDRLRLPGMVGSPLDAFVFVPKDREAARVLVERAHGPWWGHPHLHLAFWRPLSSLTHWADHRLWPARPALMHAQGLLWLGALVLAAAALFRRLLERPWVAGLAALLFAVDDAHGLPAGWVANRNALIAATFGCLAVLAHDRWRRDAWRPGVAVAPALLAVALLAGESALGAAGFIAAHALCLERGAWRSRALALAPHAAVVVAWRLAYRALGYGAYGSGLYIDPLGEPGAYALATLERWPLLLLGQLAAPPPELWMMLPPGGRLAMVAAALASLALVAWVLAPRLRRDATLRFWALGTALSALPACATFPADRLLSITGVGGMALVAAVIGERVAPPDLEPPAPSRRAPAIALGWVFVAVHGVLAPLLLPVRALTPRWVRELSTRALETAPGDAELARQTLVLVNASDVFTATYIPVWNASTGRTVPHRHRCLGATRGSVLVARTDERTLVLSAEGGHFGDPLDELVRSRELPYVAGERVELTGLRMEVTAVTDDGRPAVLTARFAVPLEDPSLRWIAFTPKGYAAFRPPPIGESIVLAPTEVFDPR